ncbi:polysaccharide lyase family 7 protein [uncultured Psychromonas sp.]|uniref:polysaccharide lyase family 7 protein n=1 Tax=uncultured Psychromonas sp. TaxID=173974 RepID=UPI0026289D54|nr:polysaccharide lyase family 7 protein [uncultured Psychromonas sp.]
MQIKTLNVSYLTAIVAASLLVSNIVSADTLLEQKALKTELSATLSAAKDPSENFNLWSFMINIPEPDHKPERKGKVLEVNEKVLNAGYTHPTWFFTDPQTGAMVFRAPNKAITTPNSSNVRSELHTMLRRGDLRINEKQPKNNFVLTNHPDPNKYGAVGGQLSATLAVDWVSTSGDDKKFPAYSVVIGQIHGLGKTEPLKIFYRKLPNHDHGSLFWNYEIRPADQNQRYDIPNDVWGNHQLTKASKDPADGIELGEIISYVINVENTMMTLTFTKALGTAHEETKVFKHDLGKGLAGHPLDRGYWDDALHLKAGAYNQCNMSTENPIWGPGCSNDGIEAGDYAQVSFYRLDLQQ